MTTRLLARRALLVAIAGLGLWSSAFVVLYGGHALACAVPLGRGATIALLLGAGALHLAAIVAIARRFRPARSRAGAAARESGAEAARDDRFLARFTIAIAVASAAATIWLLLPVLLVTPCR